ncbi:MAG: alpha/beta hydrolase, partial [bacterium]|nr:alpha/beta hydrolase [bacterium]
RLTDFHQAVEYRMAACKCFAGSRFEIAEDLLRRILTENILNRNGYNPDAGVHQSAAITTADSRLDALSRINCPALVIHGTQDPLLDHRHAVKYAARIPGARLVLLEGIGHEIPPGIINQVHEEMFRLFSRAHFS